MYQPLSEFILLYDRETEEKLRVFIVIQLRRQSKCRKTGRLVSVMISDVSCWRALASAVGKFNI